MKASLSEEAVTYDIANQLRIELKNKGKYEEAKVFFLAAFEGRRRVLGDEHKDTLASQNSLGGILEEMKDYEGTLDYYQQALNVKEKVLRKYQTSQMNSKPKTSKLVKAYPNLMSEPWVANLF